LWPRSIRHPAQGSHRRRQANQKRSSGCQGWRWLLARDSNQKLKTTQKEDIMTQTIATERSSEQTADKNAIRPFPRINFPEAELTELRRRINNTSREVR